MRQEEDPRNRIKTNSENISPTEAGGDEAGGGSVSYSYSFLCVYVYVYVYIYILYIPLVSDIAIYKKSSVLSHLFRNVGSSQIVMINC